MWASDSTKPVVWAMHSGGEAITATLLARQPESRLHS